MAKKKASGKIGSMSAAQNLVKDKFNALISNEFPLPEVDGIGFRWVNPDTRNKRGWVIWAPVEVSSELGDKVLEFIKDKPVYEANPGMVKGNLFHKGDNVLAWASEEMIIELRKHNSTKAGTQVDSIISEHGSVRNIRKIQLTRLDSEDE